MDSGFGLLQAEGVVRADHYQRRHERGRRTIESADHRRHRRCVVVRAARHRRRSTIIAHRHGLRRNGRSHRGAHDDWPEHERQGRQNRNPPPQRRHANKDNPFDGVAQTNRRPPTVRPVVTVNARRPGCQSTFPQWIPRFNDAAERLCQGETRAAASEFGPICRSRPRLRRGLARSRCGRPTDHRHTPRARERSASDG